MKPVGRTVITIVMIFLISHIPVWGSQSSLEWTEQADGCFLSLAFNQATIAVPGPDEYGRGRTYEFPGIPACGEVRILKKVKEEKPLIVSVPVGSDWRVVLTGAWKAVIHQTREACLEALKHQTIRVKSSRVKRRVGADAIVFSLEGAGQEVPENQHGRPTPGVGVLDPPEWLTPESRVYVSKPLQGSWRHAVNPIPSPGPRGEVGGGLTFVWSEKTVQPCQHSMTVVDVEPEHLLLKDGSGSDHRLGSDWRRWIHATKEECLSKLRDLESPEK